MRASAFAFDDSVSRYHYTRGLHSGRACFAQDQGQQGGSRVRPGMTLALQILVQPHVEIIVDAGHQLGKLVGEEVVGAGMVSWWIVL